METNTEVYYENIYLLASKLIFMSKIQLLKYRRYNLNLQVKKEKKIYI